MCNINTKSWNQPVSGFAKIQICSVLLVPPLVGHRTQTWYASTARWLSYCPYPCCVWSTPNLQFMLIFTGNCSAQSGDTSGNTLIQSWYTWRSFESSITKKNTWLKMSTSVTPDPCGLIEESKSVTKVSNLRRFGAFDLCCSMLQFEDLPEIIQINADICDMNFKIRDDSMMFYTKVLQPTATWNRLGK